MPKVTEIFAFIVADMDQDDEGVMAFLSGDTWLPMVGADIKRIEALRPIADSISRQMDKPYRVVRFRAVEEIELQGPPMPIDGLVFQLNERKSGQGDKGSPSRQKVIANTSKGVIEMSTVLNADDQRKMEMVNCLNTMWDVFSHHIHVSEKMAIETFVNAKDKAHQLLATMGKERNQ